jgi:hypothetical protein
MSREVGMEMFAGPIPKYFFSLESCAAAKVRNSASSMPSPFASTLLMNFSTSSFEQGKPRALKLGTNSQKSVPIQCLLNEFFHILF